VIHNEKDKKASLSCIATWHRTISLFRTQVHKSFATIWNCRSWSGPKSLFKCC
jgi:hypothetical protein